MSEAYRDHLTHNKASGAGAVRTRLWRALLPALLLAAVLVCGTALADTEGDWTYTVSGSGAAVTGYAGTDSAVVIPDTLGGVSVTSIASRAFQDHTGMVSVSIPSTVTSLGTYAFSGCSDLTSAVIPEGVTAIPGRAFMNCAALTDVSVPYSVTSIAAGAFSGTGLTRICLPEDIDTVGGSSFPAGTLLLVETAGGSMTVDAVDGDWDCVEYSSDGSAVRVHAYIAGGDTITVPETIRGLPVTSFDSGAFDPDKKLIADLSGTVAEALSGCGYIIYDPSDLTMGIRKTAGVISLARYDGADTAVTVPAFVQAVAPDAFDGNGTVCSVTVGANITALEPYSFAGASALTDVYLHGGLASFAPDGVPAALRFHCGMDSVTARTLGTGEREFVDDSVPDFVLRWDMIASPAELWLTGYTGTAAAVTVPGGVQQIGKEVFRDSALTSVTLPGGLLGIHAGAFLNAAGLTDVTLPGSLTAIESLAFRGTGITDLVIPDGLTLIRGGTVPAPLPDDIDDGAPYSSVPAGCILHSAYHSTASHTLSDAGLTFYAPGDSVFGCRYMDSYLYLVKYNGQDDVIEVPEGIEGVAYVFGVYNRMTGVRFPSTLKVIGYEAFRDCSGLTSITIPATVEEIGYMAFSGSALRSIRLPDNVRRVGYGAFMDCTNLAAVTFAVSGTNGLNAIGESAFRNTGLRSVTVPATTVRLGDYAFAQNTQLTQVTLPASGSLTSVGAYAFEKTAISSLTVPGTVTDIGEYAFARMGSLQDAVLSGGVRSIGKGAFSECSSLETVSLSSGVKTIGEDAFYHCYALHTVNIPGGVTSIGMHAFRSAVALNSVILPDSVTRMGTGAFENAGLKEGITLSAGLTELPSYAFAYSGLTQITVPDSVTGIGECAFCSCQSLADVTLSARLNEIGTGAFNGCAVLGRLELPASMTRLSQCLEGCTSAVVTVPDTLTYIQGIAFGDVRAVLGSRQNDLLKSLDRFGYTDEGSFIYTYISDDGLEDYDNLQVVDYIGTASEETLPRQVTMIRSGAFLNNATLQVLNLPDTGLALIETDEGFNRIRAVCTPGSDTEDKLVSAGHTDVYGFTYSVNGSAYTVTGFDGHASEAVLPARATAIGGYAFNSCPELRRLTLPDTGLTSIGRNAFHSVLAVDCTRNSDTWQLLIDCGCSLPVDGYPCLYAVEKEGKLYNAFYHGTAAIVDLPDNIASADSYGLEECTYWDENDESYTVFVDHAETFPFTSLYRTSGFDSETAQTLGYAGYRITVPGLEDFAFGMNSFFNYDSNTEMHEFCPYLGVNDWIMLDYRGTDKDLVLPDEITRVCTDYLNGLESLTLGDHVDIVAASFPPRFKVFFDPDSDTVRARRDSYDFEYAFPYDLYPVGHPEFVCRYWYDSNLNMPVIKLRKYIGSASVVELTGEEGFGLIGENAFGSSGYQMKGHPELTIVFGEYQDVIDGAWHYGMVVSGYTGTADTVTLGEDFYAKDIRDDAFPSGVKLLCDPASDLAMMDYFLDHSFYAAQSPDFEFRYMGASLYSLEAYTGNERDITLPDGIYDLGGNVSFSGTVTDIHLDPFGARNAPYLDSNWYNLSWNYKLFAEFGSPFLSMYLNQNDGNEMRLFTTEFPDIAYTVLDGSTALWEYYGSETRIVVPGCFTNMFPGAESQWTALGNEGRVWMYPDSRTAALFDAMGIPYNTVTTVKTVLPASLTAIGEEAFLNCGFEEVTVPDGCVSIGARAFADSSSLVMIHIPDSVTAIDASAFAGCVQVTVCCGRGSAAESFAAARGIPCVIE